MTTENTYGIYNIDVRVIVSRKSGAYSTDTLAKLSVDEELPLPDDAAAADAVRDHVNDALRKISGTMRARREFDSKVKLIESGDIIEG